MTSASAVSSMTRSNERQFRVFTISLRLLGGSAGALVGSLPLRKVLVEIEIPYDRAGRRRRDRSATALVEDDERDLGIVEGGKRDEPTVLVVGSVRRFA